MWLGAAVAPGILVAGNLLAPATPTSTFLNNGVLGAVVIVFMAAVVALFRLLKLLYDRERALLIEELESSKRRADRGDEAIRELEQVYREKYVGVLGDAARAVTDSLEALRQVKRERDDALQSLFRKERDQRDR